VPSPQKNVSYLIIIGYGLSRSEIIEVIRGRDCI
jgi:hypothetical protein